jgi:predicted outer membrane repeat protein
MTDPRSISVFFGFTLALLATVGPGCTGEEVTGPALEQSASALDYGEIPVFEESAQSVTITNAGSTAFEILSTTLVEGSSATWRVERSDDTDLDPGEVFTATLTFTPIAEGSASGRIQIRTTFDDQPNLYVDLGGRGGLSTRDNDGDGFSDATGDCDDENGAAYPGATEVCDGFDTDCDGDLPDSELDADYDGWLVCEDDCDDTDADVYPGAIEICDDKDTDCDGVIPDREDADNDGFSLCDGDCDDDDPLAEPSRVEVCDSRDSDCSGAVDDIDQDGDGHSPCRGGGDCDDDDRDAHPVVVDLDADPDGDGTLDRPYDDVQTGLDNRDEVCRTVVLVPGDYALTTTWDDGYLRIVGGGEAADEVVITPDGEGERVFNVTDGAELVLENLTLADAYASGDGGSLRAVAADLGLVGVVVRDNSCTGDGGAIAVSSGTLTLDDVTFSGNLSEDDGGAVSVLSGAIYDNGSTYDGNSGVRGGAVVIESTVLVGTGQTFTGNNAVDQGGALAAIGGSVDLEGGAFTLNSAQLVGGAAALSDISDSDSRLRNMVFQDNVAAKDGGAMAIGGSSASFLVVNNTFTGNVSGGEGAGIFVDAADASGLFLWSNVLVWSDGESGVWVAPGVGASVGWNTAYLTSSGTDFEVAAGEDAGDNEVGDPGLVDVSNDGDPTNDDLALTPGSSGRDSGPIDGSGPPTYRVWHDLDGSVNDRGQTGGQGASE